MEGLDGLTNDQLTQRYNALKKKVDTLTVAGSDTDTIFQKLDQVVFEVGGYKIKLIHLMIAGVGLYFWKR